MIDSFHAIVSHSHRPNAFKISKNDVCFSFKFHLFKSNQLVIPIIVFALVVVCVCVCQGPNERYRKANCCTKKTTIEYYGRLKWHFSDSRIQFNDGMSVGTGSAGSLHHNWFQQDELAVSTLLLKTHIFPMQSTSFSVLDTFILTNHIFLENRRFAIDDRAR